MKKKSLVSIVIPTYSRPTTLKRAIDSGLKQTYDNIEIIVVDDNDKDSIHRKETENLINKKYQNNPKVKYLKMPKNGGACKTRNFGIKNAKGEYITFLDDDDIYFPNNIEKEIEFITKNNYDMIFCDVEHYYVDTKEKYINSYKKNFDLTRKGLLKKILVDVISGTTGYVYKKEVLEDLGGFYDIPASQEYILLLNTIVGNYKIGYFNFVGSRSYFHSGETRITGSLKAIEAKKEVIKLVKPYLKELNILDRRKVMYRLNAFIFIQYLRRKNLNYIKYGFKLLPYIDLLITNKVRKKRIVNGIKYN